MKTMRTHHVFEGCSSEPLPSTPDLVLGPFYPLVPNANAGDTLWRDLAVGTATVQAVEISGLVIDVAGMGIGNVLVEMWQADEYGRYRHPAALAAQPDDPAFIGYGAIRTDRTGLYQFRTRKPGAYAQGEHTRAPHLQSL